MGCPSNGGWRVGPDMPSTAVRTVGVLFTDGFYVGGRSADGIGNDFIHPFEFTDTWSIKSATYPDNQVSDMACGILTDRNKLHLLRGRLGRRADHSY